MNSFSLCLSINIDALPKNWSSLIPRSRYDNTCFYAPRNSKNVIYLQSTYSFRFRLREVEPDEIDGLLRIETLRDIESINRAARAGFWPDVRLSNKLFQINCRLTIGQNPSSGEIDANGDARFMYPKINSADEFVRRRKNRFLEAIPFRTVSQREYSAIAAYMIPSGTPDGTRIKIPDLIEEIPCTYKYGTVFSLYDSGIGTVMNMKVVLDPDYFETRDISGVVG